MGGPAATQAIFLLLWQDFINVLKTNSIYEVLIAWGI